MLTLQELKEITETTKHGMKMPTARNLRETGRAVAEKQLKNDTWIIAYQNGFALYHACGHSTVFPIHTCGAYLYVSNGISSYLPELFLRKSRGVKYGRKKPCRGSRAGRRGPGGRNSAGRRAGGFMGRGGRICL